VFAAATDATNRCVVKGRGCVVVFAHTVVPKAKKK
jgi:hypothetical protein